MQEQKFNPRQFLICGLDGAGKTTMIKNWIYQSDSSRGDELITSTPLINVEHYKTPGKSQGAIFYDMSGQGRYREQWQYYYPDVDAIFYVIDKTDRDRIYINKEILKEMARHPGLQDREIPFVILCNKMAGENESAHYLSQDQVKNAIEYSMLQTKNDLKYKIFEIDSMSREGFEEINMILKEF
jgi:ADP-ribosylation factor-like protein 6